MAVPETSFHFSSDGIELEFAGSESFVEQQLSRFATMLQSFAGAQSGGAISAPSPRADRMTFAAFASQRPIRRGRGAIQDRILLCFAYLRDEMSKEEVGTDDIGWCFRQAEWDVPKTLLNHLGLLKRKHEQLQEGSRRGLYRLSPKGLRHIQSRFG